MERFYSCYSSVGDQLRENKGSRPRSEHWVRTMAFLQESKCTVIPRIKVGLFHRRRHHEIEAPQMLRRGGRVLEVRGQKGLWLLVLRTWQRLGRRPSDGLHLTEPQVPREEKKTGVWKDCCEVMAHWKQPKMVQHWFRWSCQVALHLHVWILQKLKYYNNITN